MGGAGHHKCTGQTESQTQAQSDEEHLRLTYSGSDDQSRSELLAVVLLKWEPSPTPLLSELSMLSMLSVLLLAVLLAGASSLLLSSSSSASKPKPLAVVARDT